MLEESRRASISENVLVNQVLKKWAIFDRFVTRQNIMMFNRRIFARLVVKLSEEDLIEIAKELAPNLVVDLFDLVGMDLQRDNVIDYYLKTVLSDSMRWYTYEHHGTNQQGSFVLRHDMGKSWSIFLKTFIDATLYRCFELSLNFRISNDAVFFNYSF